MLTRASLHSARSHDARAAGVQQCWLAYHTRGGGEARTRARVRGNRSTGRLGRPGSRVAEPHHARAALPSFRVARRPGRRRLIRNLLYPDVRVGVVGSALQFVAPACCCTPAAPGCTAGGGPAAGRPGWPGWAPCCLGCHTCLWFRLTRPPFRARAGASWRTGSSRRLLHLLALSSQPSTIAWRAWWTPPRQARLGARGGRREEREEGALSWCLPIPTSSDRTPPPRVPCSHAAQAAAAAAAALPGPWPNVTFAGFDSFAAPLAASAGAFGLVLAPAVTAANLPGFLAFVAASLPPAAVQAFPGGSLRVLELKQPAAEQRAVMLPSLYQYISPESHGGQIFMVDLLARVSSSSNVLSHCVPPFPFPCLLRACRCCQSAGRLTLAYGRVATCCSPTGLARALPRATFRRQQAPSPSRSWTPPTVRWAWCFSAFRSTRSWPARCQRSWTG